MNTENEARRKDAEDAFQRCYMDYAEGKSTEQDWEHIAWEMGIHDFYKRLQEKAA